jgi:hypothetical protein
MRVSRNDVINHFQMCPSSVLTCLKLEVAFGTGILNCCFQQKLDTAVFNSFFELQLRYEA